MKCPTPCDDDCEAACHEAHLAPRLRDHDPDECRRRMDFYEDDEPLDAVIAAFERGERGVTAPPADPLAWLPGYVFPAGSNRALGEVRRS